MMKLHLLGLPHTISNAAHSHCAFTEKIRMLAAMMTNLGHEVIHYGVEGAETKATEQVDLLTQREQSLLRGHDGSDPSRFYDADVEVDNALFREFNRELRVALEERVEPGDLVLCPFGHGHQAALKGHEYTLVESGIGYPHLYKDAPWKIFDSYAWMHFHQGKADRNGMYSEWVVPNGFDPDAWKAELDPPKDTVVFLGRIGEVKGMNVVWELAKMRPDLHFVLCGQGDPKRWLTLPNLEYRTPISGTERSAYFGQALACLTPTQFVEPFNLVAVESQMCGTPVISTDFGGFTETIEHGVTGFRCHTLGDYLAALEGAESLDRSRIAAQARTKFGMDVVAKTLEGVLRQIRDAAQGQGWNTLRSLIGPSCPE